MQIAFARSNDERFEMIGDFAIHFGHQFSSTSTSTTPTQNMGTPPPNNTPTPSNLLLGYRIGPGVRYWLMRHFALQGTAGFGGHAWFDLPVSGTPATGNNSSHGIFASLGVLGAI